MRRGAKPAKPKVEAKKPATARKSLKNDGSRVPSLEKRLAEALKRETEALDQQTATAEILRVISSSPTDVQPVFDAIVRTASRLCEADYGFLARYDGTSMAIVAHSGATDEEIEAVLRVYPMAPTPDSLGGRTILERTVVHIPDVRSDPTYGLHVIQDAGWRTGLGVPLLRKGAAIGLLGMWRRDVRPFSDRQIELLNTFAAHAVIAIENARLFNETKEALEQQTATAEILRVIASSPTDIRPVFDTMAESAARLCEAYDSAIFRREGDRLLLVAHHGPMLVPGPVGKGTVPLVRGTANGRSVLDGRTIHVANLQSETDQFPEGGQIARQLGVRTHLSVPLIRDGTAIGTINLRRTETRLFSDRQVALLETFADQAVIAIENVRLFKELQARNRELTEALEQQTATAEILAAISASPTDVQPVFETIARSAVRLCEALFSSVVEVDGAVVRLRATHGFAGEALASLRRRSVVPLDADFPSGQAIRERTIVHLPDTEASRYRELGRERGFRSFVSVPMFRGDGAIGTIAVARAEPRPFSDRQIALLETFAAQAVIAIENVRLFTELQEKNRALTQAHAQVTEALEQQTATGEILRVIASSPTDLQPVMDAVAENAARVCGAMYSSIFRLEGEHLRLVARHGSLPRPLAIGDTIPVSRDSVGGRAVCDRRVIHVLDLFAAEAEFPETASRARQADSVGRTLLATPLLREGMPLGVILINRGPEVHPFSEKQIALLETFANQAVIAIENVRLFNETREALERQTATSEVLRVISRFQTDIQPVFDAIAAKALGLCRATTGWVYTFDGELIHVAAAHSLSPEGIEARRQSYPMPPGRGGATSRAVLSGTVVYIPNIREDHEYTLQTLAEAAAYLSVLAVPMLREGQPIGVITVTGAEVGAFSQKQIDLLETFADQAVIAVENVRLFTELQARTQDLTRSVGELQALGDVGRALSSTLDLDTVLQTIVTRASQLAGTDACSVFEYDEATEAFHLRAIHNLDEEVVALAWRTPIRIGEGIQGRMAVTRRPVQMPDIAEGDVYRGPLRDVLLRTGTRALLAIPMLREDQLIGGFTVTKKTPGEFSPEVIELLQTFATQSALAIQNARLFREIADKSQQLEAASRHKSEFLANMSHELRTPLNAIIGFSEVLAERMFGEVNEKQAEYLQDILASGRHLLSLINDILDLSKVEAGRLELELGQFHLPTALDNALALVRERATQHGITLTATIDERVGEIVADERKVKQILLNLLSNAVKFTPDGGRVGLTATVAEGEVTIAVSDTGIGIAPEDQAAVFEEFRQVGGDGARKAEGTGLGLTLAKKFVELHGGRIWVQSEVGSGSTFTFSLSVSHGE